MNDDRDTVRNDAIRNDVRTQYGAIAEAEDACCVPAGCAGTPEASLALGYSSADLAAVPEGANMGLGCGNPHAIAALRPGEVVLDLGCGAGFDAFLAAEQVTTTGQVIGVDMTPAMISRARQHADTMGTSHVEFRLGEIESLPVADGTVDVILSNCVINLSPDKHAVFAEAFRVLAPGGRLAISDIVEIQPIPPELRADAATLIGCVSGAASVEEIRTQLAEVGFDDIDVDVRPESRDFIKDWFPGRGAEDYVASARITARKAGTPRVAPEPFAP